MHKPFLQTVVGTLVLDYINLRAVIALSTRVKRCLQTVIDTRQELYHICFAGGYGSFYARMFMREFPEHGDLFRCRKTFIYEREFDQRLQRIFEDLEAV